jgi:hypothetical protein
MVRGEVIRASVLVASSHADAARVRKRFRQYRFYVSLTPNDSLSGFKVDEYVWTPLACNLPASVRLQLRGMLSGLIDAESTEEDFPDALLSW